MNKTSLQSMHNGLWKKNKSYNIKQSVALTGRNTTGPPLRAFC